MRHFFRFHPDSLGFWTSLLCGLHCVVLPFVLTFVSSGLLTALGSPFVEGVIIGISLSIGVFSLVPGYAAHRKPAPVFFLVVGFILIALSRLNIPMLWETSLTILGAVLIAWAHYSNWKASHTHKNSFLEKTE